MIIGKAISLFGGKKLTLPTFTYTGSWAWIEQSPDAWSIKFTSSGTLTVSDWGGHSSIEICGTGGGGGGGGGRAMGSGYGGYGYYG